MEVRGGAMGPPHAPLATVFAPGAQRTRSLSLDTIGPPQREPRLLALQSYMQDRAGNH